jgi:hypothetical protein
MSLKNVHAILKKSENERKETRTVPQIVVWIRVVAAKPQRMIIIQTRVVSWKTCCGSCGLEVWGYDLF